MHHFARNQTKMKETRTIENNITTINLNGIEYSAINIGPEASGVPKHIMQAERQNGMIIDREEIRPFYWRGVTKDQKYQYVYFDKANIEPFETITTKHREIALSLIRDLAYGIMKASNDFLDMAVGVFPLYRVYIIDERKILILPPDMGALIAISKIGDCWDKDLGALKKKNTEKGFTLIQEMAELMYWSISGRLPYENKDIRISDYDEVPLSWYEPKIDGKVLGFIEFILHAKERQMRDISGNRKANENLSWFIKRCDSLSWDFKNRTLEEREEAIDKCEETEQFKHFFKKTETKAKKRNFWRIKGTLILSLVAVLLVVSTIAGTILKSKLSAPYTRDMSQIEIVEDFFKNMNNIDPSNMENNAFKAQAPQYNAVMGLYVNKQTRAAYESINPAVNLDSWLDEGKPAIPSTSFIYGADINEITTIGDNKVRASGTWYSPYSDDDSLKIDIPEGYTVVYMYDVDEDFTFEWSKRGWWTVTEIEISKYEYIGYELVETYAEQSAMEKLLGST